MHIQKIATNEPLLEELSKKFKFFNKLFFALFFVCILVWVALMIFISANLIIDIQVDNILSRDVVDLVEVLFTGAIATLVFLVLGLFFRDISKKETPFSLNQVKRMKLLSLLFVGYGIVDLIVSMSFASIELMEGFGVVYASTSSTPETTVSVNITAFVAAIVAYALSMAFEYGIELQRQSDSFL